MLIKCTEEQVKKMAAAAINSSIPMGLGFLHHDPSMKAKPEDIEIYRNEFHGDTLTIDYYQGRMVKFHARKMSEDTWDFTPEEPTSDYQSWIGNYPTYQDLFNAVAND